MNEEQREILYQKNEYIVIQNCKRDIIVINTSGEYQNHAHLFLKRNKNGDIILKTAALLIDLVISRQYIRSSYLRKAALRLSLDEDYKEFLKRKEENKKQKFYNSPGHKDLKREKKRRRCR